jgi:signal peptidase I
MLAFGKPSPDQSCSSAALAHGHQLLRLSRKVLAYRQDLCSPEERLNLKEAQRQLETQLLYRNAEGCTPQQLAASCQALEDLLRAHGGKLYPQSFWSENVETLLVASILALGIRVFFFQPFKIPTNSMYPSYAGMCPHVYSPHTAGPSWLQRGWRWLQHGAKHYHIPSPAPGSPVGVPLFNAQERAAGLGWVRFRWVYTRRWGLLRTQQREYTVYVNNTPVSLRVPAEFSLDEVVLRTFFPAKASFEEVLLTLPGQSHHGLCSSLFPVLQAAAPAGKSLLRFDILTGDMLFVNRLAYHFTSPKVGEPIVFRTKNIWQMRQSDGSPEDKYYIKRLAGLPGDTLGIAEPTLYHNGRPAQGAFAFGANASTQHGYSGYRAQGLLGPGHTYTVRKGAFCLGDNSGHSLDSRFWGEVPRKDIVGRACFIFYPFSSRFGKAP